MILTSFPRTVRNMALENPECSYIGLRGPGLYLTCDLCVGGRPLRNWMTLTLRQKTSMSEVGQASRQKMIS